MKTQAEKGEVLLTSTPSRLRTLSLRSLKLLLFIICSAIVYSVASQQCFDPSARISSHLPAWTTLQTPAQPNQQFVYELADTMKDFYRLLIRMRYLKADAVSYPPHNNPSINVTLARELGMSEDAILLLQQLPYVKTDDCYDGQPEHSFVYFGSAKPKFVLGSLFGDFRDDKMLQESRSPWEPRRGIRSAQMDDSSQEPYLKPWHVVLTLPGSYEDKFLAVDLKTRLSHIQ